MCCVESRPFRDHRINKASLQFFIYSIGRWKSAFPPREGLSFRRIRRRRRIIKRYIIMRATTIQTTTTTQFTTGGANTSSSRNQIQKITNAGTKVDNLHRGRTTLTRRKNVLSRPFTRVVVVSSSSSNDHDVLGLRGGQTKRRGVGVVARGRHFLVLLLHDISRARELGTRV